MALTATAQVENTSILSILAAPFVAIGNGLIALSEANSRVRTLEILQNMSDEELAKRGLQREDIVRHVFADKMGL